MIKSHNTSKVFTTMVLPTVYTRRAFYYAAGKGSWLSEFVGWYELMWPIFVLFDDTEQLSCQLLECDPLCVAEGELEIQESTSFHLRELPAELFDVGQDFFHHQITFLHPGQHLVIVAGMLDDEVVIVLLHVSIFPARCKQHHVGKSMNAYSWPFLDAKLHIGPPL